MDDGWTMRQTTRDTKRDTRHETCDHHNFKYKKYLIIIIILNTNTRYTLLAKRDYAIIRAIEFKFDR